MIEKAVVRSSRLNLCGVDCVIEEFGTATGKPLVVLHGWLDNLASFYPVIPYLMDYRVIALDFPGHGKSAHLPNGMAYHFMDLVYVLQDLVSCLKLGDFFLMGHSMGGAVATLFSSVESTVKKLILAINAKFYSRA